MSRFANLTTFVSVARLGSFAAAGRQLAVSPAMVGRRIQSLEDDYGVRLVERTTRSLRLTDVGHRFFEHAVEIVEAVDQLDDIAHEDELALAGRVRISGPTTLGVGRLASIVADLSERWPKLIIELQLADRRVDLIGEGFDLAIRIGQPGPSGLIARRIGTYRFAVCAAPSLLKRYGIPRSLKDLGTMPCVLNLNMSARDRWPFLDGEGNPVAAPVQGHLEIDSDEAQRVAGIEGAGVIYVPRHLVRDDIAAGRLVEVLADCDRPAMPINAVHPSRRFVPRRVTAVIEGIAAGLADDDGDGGAGARSRAPA